MTKQTRAVVFVTDLNYVLPTTVAALQACRSVGSIARVFIVATGLETASAARLRSVLSHSAIEVLEMPEVTLPPGSHFNPSHIAPSALGRFMAVDFLPREVDHIVYLDGDVQVLGDITPLVLADVKPGRLAAANDVFWLQHFRRRPIDDQYLRGLGVERSEYFNSGVLVFKRETWTTLAPLALQYFADNSKLCLYHDQSALNAIFKGRRDAIDPSFNFITEYTRIFRWAGIRPRILHFTGALKPWHPTSSWRRHFREPYLILMDSHPGLREFAACADRSVDEMDGTDRRRNLIQLVSGLALLRSWQLKRYRSGQKFVARAND